MRKKRILKSFIGGVLLCTILCVNVLATDCYYVRYRLNSGQENNYTNVHTKTETHNWIWNKVTYCDDDATTFWACDANRNQISKDYDQSLNDIAKLYYTKSGYNKKGKKVCMGMENAAYRWIPIPAYVSGTVNFH